MTLGMTFVNGCFTADRRHTKRAKTKDHLIVLRLCLLAYLDDKPVPFVAETLQAHAKKCKIRPDKQFLTELAGGHVTLDKRLLNQRAYELTTYWQ